MNKKIIILLIITAAFLFTGFGVYAHNLEFHNNLVKKIADKFNLKESDVNAVFETQRQEHQTEMQRNLADKLTQAVKDGKINETQKQEILKHHQEMIDNKPDFTEFKNLTLEQRRQKMAERRTENEKWSSEIGLNLETLQEITGMGGGFRMKGFRFMH